MLVKISEMCEACDFRLHCLSLKGCLRNPEWTLKLICDEVRHAFPEQQKRVLCFLGNWSGREKQIVSEAACKIDNLEIIEDINYEQLTVSHFYELDLKVAQIQEIFNLFGFEFHMTFNCRYMEDWTTIWMKPELAKRLGDQATHSITAGFLNVLRLEDIYSAIGVLNSIRLVYSFCANFSDNEIAREKLRYIVYSTDS